MNYANSCRITPHIFANCLFSFAFLLFPSLTRLSFFSSFQFLSFYPYLRSFRLSSLISLIFVHFAYLRSFRPNCIRASALLSRHISTKLGRSPVSPFLFSFRPNDIRLHRHRSKTAFFLPLLQKKSQLSCKSPFFFVPLHRNWSNGRFLLDKTAEFQQHRIHPRIALRDNIFNNKHYYYFAFEKKKA